ncbi:MAG: glucose-6-phosphate dehydrogenase [Alphaproteobacteria bacterium]|nr:glucose-6-phosphate dehydrogenase [Alphaproteobacteria bacterium]
MAETGSTSRREAAPPCTLVIFGATGDLTKRLVMPAVYNLMRSGLISRNFAIVGLGRSEQTDKDFAAYLAKEVRGFMQGHEMGGVPIPFDEEAWGFIESHISYLAGDLNDAGVYKRLSEHLKKLDAENGTKGNVVFYLAVAASMFGPIVDRLGEAGLAQQDGGSFRRVIIEKPFGTDLDSARALNARVRKVLDEDQIYRIDHFLGKETVQNIMVLRFANGIFEPLWNRDHIDHVQITVAETVGVERRASFYEQTGALRDMVPNHVFQLLSLIAMEPPNSFAADAVRTEKTKVLEAVAPLDQERVRRNVVRGQYSAGTVRGNAVEGYRESQGVAKESATETYVAMRLDIENWRWAGVPFYLRTGKSMTRRTTEISIQFKTVPFALFRDTSVDTLTRNVLSFQLQPDEGVSLQFDAKRPGPEIEVGGVKMDFKYKDYFQAAPATGYETLIYDCMIGDAMLFQRADSVEAGWAVVQPALDYWRNDHSAPLEFYPAGSAGPDAADQLLWRSGRQWRPLE